MHDDPSTRLQPLKALIFDVDGTIAETEEAHRQAFNAAFADAGLDWRWDRGLYKTLLKVTGGAERMHHYITAHRPEQLAEIAPGIADLHRIKTGHFADIVAAGGVEPRPGVVRLMSEARAAGLLVAIATTMSRPSLDALLPPILGPDCYEGFAAIATGDRVASKKPAPDLYQLALAELGVEPENAVAIEDSAVGLAAARAAGIATLVTPSVYTSDDDFEGAARTLPSLSELRGPVAELTEILNRSPIQR